MSKCEAALVIVNWFTAVSYFLFLSNTQPCHVYFLHVAFVCVYPNVHAFYAQMQMLLAAMPGDQTALPDVSAHECFCLCPTVSTTETHFLPLLSTNAD